MSILKDIKEKFDKETKKRPHKPAGFTRYDYSDEEHRVNTVNELFERAKNERAVRELVWTRMNEYYNGEHSASKEIAESAEEMGIPFIPATVPDPYLMVESQINPDVPVPEFHGRDGDLDSDKAQIRQKAVKFVTENNRLNDMNTANERRLRKYGDAFWKVWWDKDMPCGREFGDIRVRDIPIEDIYVDPTARRLEDAEYIDYVYTMHKNRFWRIWRAELEKKNISISDIQDRQYREYSDLLQEEKTASTMDDEIQIIEHWFRQPIDGENYESGDIACTVQAGNIEIVYIPCYWENTHVQNKTYPFVHYWCIGDETGFYNRSELQPIIDMVDAADRELATGLLNDAMMANDIILKEEGALVPGSQATNEPGAVWEVRQGKMGGVARLGGLSNGVRSTDMINWLQNQMQRANRNYDTNNGQETAKVTTASGLLQLRSDAAVQGELKKADRNKGFCRLYELIDWTCLEFYTDSRLLYLGIDEKTKEPDSIVYDSAMLAESEYPIKVDVQTGEITLPEDAYYPRIDVTVTTGDGLGKNPASTIQILDRLAAVTPTSDNWELLAAELEYLDIPQKQQIIDRWKQKFTSEIPAEVITALQNDPKLLEAVQQMAQGGQNPSGQQLGINDLVDTGMDIPKY